jgi:hypothetical protein
MSGKDIRCPTPDKIRYATVELAQQRAISRNHLNKDGKTYHPYSCDCGWIHLTTTRGKKNILETPHVSTPEDLLALTPVEFRFIVSCDVKNRLNPTTSEILRTPKVNVLWNAELRLLWMETIQEYAQARDKAHKQDILAFQRYIGLRRAEARNLRQRYAEERRLPPQKIPEEGGVAATFPTLTSRRRQAFRGAIHELINQHFEEFRGMYHEQLSALWPEDREVPRGIPLKFLRYLEKGEGSEDPMGVEED